MRPPTMVNWLLNGTKHAALILQMYKSASLINWKKIDNLSLVSFSVSQLIFYYFVFN